MVWCSEMRELLVDWILGWLRVWEGSEGVAVGWVGCGCGWTVELGRIRGAERTRTVGNCTRHELLGRWSRSCDSTFEHVIDVLTHRIQGGSWSGIFGCVVPPRWSCGEEKLESV